MGHTFTSSCFHCIFITKGRRPDICPELQERFWPYIGGIARDNGMTALAIGGVADHVHLLLMMPASLAVAKAMQRIKAGSSGWVHHTFPSHRSFGWQDGYAAFSVSLSLVPKVIAYIQNQAAHHQTQTFDEEFVAFLKRHRILYDPKARVRVTIGVVAFSRPWRDSNKKNKELDWGGQPPPPWQAGLNSDAPGGAKEGRGTMGEGRDRPSVASGLTTELPPL